MIIWVVMLDFPSSLFLIVLLLIDILHFVTGRNLNLSSSLGLPDLYLFEATILKFVQH